MTRLSALEFALAFSACLVGTVVQGAIGFGFALVSVPVLLLLVPESVPVTPILLALPLTVTIALRELRALDVRGAVEVMAGRVPGTVAGAWIVAAAGTRLLSGLIGGLLLLAAAASVGLRAEPGRPARLVAGFVSGIMGTVAAVGGPAVALAYQTRPGPEIRATLSVTFVLGILISLAALAVAGEPEGWHAELALALLPAVVVGLIASGPLAGRLDGGRLRPVILLFAAGGGVVAILRSAF